MKLVEDSHSPDRAHDEAAHWYARRHSGMLTAEELAAFEAWRNESPQNADAWTAVEATHREMLMLAQHPELAAMRREALQSPGQRAGSARWRVAASIVAMLAGAAGMFALLHRDGQAPEFAVVQSQSYRTAVGEMRTVTLADGSSMTLNTDSEIRVPTAWAGQRNITLVRGEGFFRVAKDATRPFIVDAGQGNVRAVGTAFSVRKVNGGFRVALAEGKVEVVIASRGEDETLEPGQTLAYDGMNVKRSDAGAELATGWLAGEVTFQNVTLAEAISEMNRYSPRKIVLARDAAAGSRKLSGVFKTGDVATFALTVVAYGMARIESEDAAEIRLSGV